MSGKQATLALLRNISREFNRIPLKNSAEFRSHLFALARANRDVSESQARELISAAQDYLLLLQSDREQQVICIVT